MNIRNFFAGLCLCCEPGDMNDDLWEKRMRMQQHQQNRVARKAHKEEAVKLAKIQARKAHLEEYGLAPARPAQALRTQSDSVLAARPRTRLQATAADTLPAGLSLPPPALARVRYTEDVPMPAPPPAPPRSPQPPTPRTPTSPLQDSYFPASSEGPEDSVAPLPPPRPAPARAPSSYQRRLPTRQLSPEARYSMPANVGDYLSKGY